MQITAENILLVSSILPHIRCDNRENRATAQGCRLLLVFLSLWVCCSESTGLECSSTTCTAQFIGMVGLCIILFQRRSEHQFQGNTSCNRTRSHPCHRRVLLTAVLSGVFIYLLSRAEWTNIHFTPAVAILLAATMSSTDSASVFGILGRPQRVPAQQSAPGAGT